MVENKLLKKISTKYQNLLEKYEDKVEELSIEDIKRLIGEVRFILDIVNRHVLHIYFQILKKMIMLHIWQDQGDLT